MRYGLKNIYRWCLAAVIVLLPWTGWTDIINLGTFGRPYPIEEKDAGKEIEERAQNVDWAKLFSENKTKSLKNYRPENILKLPRAVTNRTFQVDMTYTLQHDIHDAEGNYCMEWKTVDDWLKWMDSEDAKELQWQIDSIIGEKTFFDVYKPENF